MAAGPTTFAVAHPERWWLVMRSEVDLTPDPRWADAPPLKWKRIAYAIEELGRDLVFGATRWTRPARHP